MSHASMRTGFVVVSLAMTLSACGSTLQAVGSSALAGSGGQTTLRPSAGSFGEGAGSASSGASNTMTGQPGSPGAGQADVGGPTGVNGGTVTGQPTGSAGSAGLAGSGSAGSGSTGSATSPIQVGILDDTSPAAAAEALGGSVEDSSSSQDEMSFYISYLNAHGGLDGRHIDPVEDYIDPESDNYESQLEAACADFTQDHHVAVAVSFLTNYFSENYASCLSKAKVPDISLLSGGTDQTDLSQYPMLVSPSSPTVNQRYAALINGLDQAGFFSPQTKIGVVVEDCTYNERAYTDSLGPLFSADHLSVDRRDVACVQGFTDAASFITQVQAEVLPFKVAGVSRVMFVSGFEGIAAFAFQTQAGDQGYAPSYGLTSTASPGVNGMDFSAAAEKRVAGVGWEPDFDVTASTESSPATTACRKAWVGFPNQDRGSNWTDDIICDAFSALAAALHESHGRSDPASLINGFDALGNTYQSPLTIQGETLYAADHREGPVLFARDSYVASCSCFQYTSKPSALG